VSRASATLSRAAAFSGRLRGVLFCDAGDGGRPDVDAVGQPVSDDDANDPNAPTIVVPIGEPLDFIIGEPVHLAVTFSDRRDSRGDRRPGDACAEPDTRPRSRARRSGGGPRS
jgi:hypothetical protein